MERLVMPITHTPSRTSASPLDSEHVGGKTRRVRLFLTDEQVAMATVVQDLMEAEVVPRISEAEAAGCFPEWLRELFRSYDLFTALIPEEHGGLDGSLLSQCVIIEEVARVWGSGSMVLGAQSLGATPIALAGSEEQKRRWLPLLASGEKLVSFGLTEPGAGSDARGILTRAKPTGEGWVLNGTKSFITHANVADVIVVFARVEEDGQDRITAFLMETDQEGFTVGTMEHKMGLRGSPTCAFAMNDVWIPRENLLGRVGDGFRILTASLDKGRISVASQAIGIGRGAVEIASAYSLEREQFGASLAKLPAIQQLVADMVTQMEAARCLTYTAALKYDTAARDMRRFSAMAKLFSSDMAMKVTTDAVQVMGGYGYCEEYGVERAMRDAKVLQIFEGTNQIQRMLIAHDFFERPSLAVG